MAQAWRESKECGTCSECARIVEVDYSGEEIVWHQCLQDGHETRPYLAACPLHHGDADED